MIPAPLPPVPKTIRDEYRALVLDLDRLIVTLSQRLRSFINCGPGCSSCCRKFSVLPLEAALIAGPPAPSVRSIGGEEQCPLLDNNRCTIYQQRPLICRTQGLPIGYVDETNEQIEVSACPLNFSEDHPFEYDDLLLLDPFNSRLAALNRSYCQKAGLAADLRLPLE